MSKSEASGIVTPTFIVGGAPRAGTTSLYRYLEQHPQVCMSARKETSVFIDDRSLEWLSTNYYRHYDGEPAVGEASAGTLGNPAVAERMYDALPEVRLIFVLRDPVERLHSHFTYLEGQQEIERGVSFSDFIRSTSDWRDTLIDLGRYHDHLTRFTEYFDRGQMLILLFRQLRSGPADVMKRVYRFVGVDPSFQPDFDIHNPTRTPRYDGLHRVLVRAWEGVRGHLDVYLRNQLRPLRRRIKGWVTEEANRGSMSPDDRAYLRRLYRKPNRRLEQWLGRDLSHWT